ncbi:MAG: hypothetical protein JO033_01605 [Acidobacteriaceae bacterium]|nr:hypothetical protein [Acidobacteriaceae bacterium]MBV9502314.1 hypothetical protein [Acidobacteriaceae bacterium]
MDNVRNYVFFEAELARRDDGKLIFRDGTPMPPDLEEVIGNSTHRIECWSEERRWFRVGFVNLPQNFDPRIELQRAAKQLERELVKLGEAPPSCPEAFEEFVKHLRFVALDATPERRLNN